MPSGDATAPGTTLAYGDSAIVALDKDKPDELVQLTIQAPRAGSADELATLNVEGLKGDEGIYYMDMTITNISMPADGGDYSPSMSEQLGGLLPDGNFTQPVIQFRSYDLCDSESPDSLAPGESFDNCEIALTAAGQPISAIVFLTSVTAEPITWK